jgi:hypothetical protein
VEINQTKTTVPNSYLPFAYSVGDTLGWQSAPVATGNSLLLGLHSRRRASRLPILCSHCLSMKVGSGIHIHWHECSAQFRFPRNKEKRNTIQIWYRICSAMICRRGRWLKLCQGAIVFGGGTGCLKRYWKHWGLSQVHQYVIKIIRCWQKHSSKYDSMGLPLYPHS